MRPCGTRASPSPRQRSTEKPRAILIDVKRCTFLDSTAIAVILGARQRAIDAGIGFALVGHNPTIDRTLELTGLGEELEILTDRDEAIAPSRWTEPLNEASRDERALNALSCACSDNAAEAQLSSEPHAGQGSAARVGPAQTGHSARPSAHKRRTRRLRFARRA